VLNCEIVVEIGNSHEGSLGIAKSFMEMAASSGARIVKFQMHLPNFESTEFEPFRKKFSDQDSSRIDYWKRTSFSKDAWEKIINHAAELELEFLCTPFSVEAAQWLFNTGAVKRWKVGSGDAANLPLLDYLVSTELPIIISTGLISWHEILYLKNRLESFRALDRVTFLHCVSEYPTPAEKSGFNIFHDLVNEFGKAGFSDHSGNVLTGLYAISQNATLLEVHLTPHKGFFGPDTSSSLLPEEIELLCKFNDFVQNVHSNNISKERLFEDSAETRKIFRKGIYWSSDKLKGQIITTKDLLFRKPMVGIDAIDFEKILGSRIRHNVKFLNAVQETDLEIDN
jgi:N,N'-diacetyllegionaminate synthase